MAPWDDEIDNEIMENEMVRRLPDIMPKTTISSRSTTLHKSMTPRVLKLCPWDRQPVADRSIWWKSTIKPTPAVGTYRSRTFIEDSDMNPVSASYQFKNDGRKKDIWKTFPNGQCLMPGAYSYQQLMDLINENKKSYGFKNKPRPDNSLTEGLVDKNLDTSPGAYEVETYLGIHVERQPSGLFMFRSKTRRLPSKEFIGKEGPEPGKYDYKLSRTMPVESCFKNTSSRFKSSVSKVPGPGTYDKTIQNPMPTSIASMGRQHGLFFSSAFSV